MDDYESFVLVAAKYLVNYPEEVAVVKTVDDRGVLLTLSVNEEDLRHIIGKGGNTARALRTLLRVVGARSKARVSLKLDEPPREEDGMLESRVGLEE